MSSAALAPRLPQSHVECQSPVEERRGYSFAPGHGGMPPGASTSYPRRFGRVGWSLCIHSLLQRSGGAASARDVTTAAPTKSHDSEAGGDWQIGYAPDEQTGASTGYASTSPIGLLDLAYVLVVCPEVVRCRVRPGLLWVVLALGGECADGRWPARALRHATLHDGESVVAGKSQLNADPRGCSAA